MRGSYTAAIISPGLSIAVPGCYANEDAAINAALEVVKANKERLVGHVYVHVAWVDTTALEVDVDTGFIRPAYGLTTEYLEAHSHGTFKLEVKASTEEDADEGGTAGGNTTSLGRRIAPGAREGERLQRPESPAGQVDRDGTDGHDDGTGASDVP
jgi:hypothetical protein